MPQQLTIPSMLSIPADLKARSNGVAFPRAHRFLRRCLWRGALLALLLGSVSPANAAEFQVAVASNFIEPAQALAERFAQDSGHQAVLVFGSTGKHFAQISHGAPFAAFLAADRKRPQMLEAQGLAVAGSGFVYAIGRIALWSPDPALVDAAAQTLSTKPFTHLAIANPRLAPYGIAAQQTLQALGLWDGVESRLVRGENIAQTYQFVRSGNAELGFVALSQIVRPNAAADGSRWEVPASSHDPIEQGAVLLKEDPAARAFLEFVQQDSARELIRAFGYSVP